MRSSLPKVLHPVCGRPMVAWPILAAREAGRGAGRGDRLARPRPLRGPARRRRDRRPAASPTAPAARCARPLDAGSRRPRPCSSSPATIPLVSRRDHRRACSRPTAAAGAAATVMTTELEDPGSYGRVVRDADGEVERIVEAKAAGDATRRGARDPRDQRRHLRLRRRRRWPTRSTASTNDNAQGEYYLPRRAAAAARGRAGASPPTSPTTRR